MAASSLSSIYRRELGTFGLISNPTRLSDGTAARSNSMRLRVTSSAKLLSPVKLPVGLARLSTSLLPTGSGTTMNTIGIVEVAFCSASADDTLAASRMSGLVSTNSIAMRSNLAGSSLGKR